MKSSKGKIAKKRKEEAMRKIAFIIMFCIIISILGCTNNPEKSVAPEKYPGLYDNGKNLAWVNETDSTKTMKLVQRWIDEHPSKIITALSSDGTGGTYGSQTGWMFIYFDKEYAAEKSVFEK
jgi:hypothetical protein